MTGQNISIADEKIAKREAEKKPIRLEKINYKEMRKA